MKVIRVFFLGLIYGWFMRWIIDQIFLNDNLRMITNENEQLRERIRSLETNRPLETRPIMQSTATPQPDQRPAPAARAAAPAPAITRSQRTSSRKDDLKKIKGIGPVMEKKLNAAGVTTFEQFSRLTAQEVQNILGLSKRVVQSTDNLLTQAKQLAQKRAKR
jgi:predicted flap endonuclease-1-like 5' DNA nuclease